MTTVALPPGFYTIQTAASQTGYNDQTVTAKQGIVNPNDTTGKVVKVTSASLTARDQQWQISGNGLILGLNSAHGYIYGSSTAPTGTILVTNTSPCNWIINVVAGTGGTYTGPIVTNDCLRQYVGVDSNSQVVLQDGAFSWIFTAI